MSELREFNSHKAVLYTAAAVAATAAAAAVAATSCPLASTYKFERQRIDYGQGVKSGFMVEGGDRRKRGGLADGISMISTCSTRAKKISKMVSFMRGLSE
jgi:hypothetical protein